MSDWEHVEAPGSLHCSCSTESTPGPGSSHLQQGGSAELRVTSHSSDNRGKSHSNSKSSGSTRSSTPSISISETPSFKPLLHLIYFLGFTCCTKHRPLPSKARGTRHVSFPDRILLLLLQSASQGTSPFSRNSQDFTSCLFNTAEPPKFTADTKEVFQPRIQTSEAQRPGCQRAPQVSS